MPPAILSLHHVTATVGEAVPDLTCYEGQLGLRLVKKTVNFDNPFVYHFYYGDELGTPSTIWTTFPYHGWQVPPGVKGAGQIVATTFSIPAGSLDFWRDRLTTGGVRWLEGVPRFGSETLVFEDPSGLVIELAAERDDQRAPWAGGPVQADVGIRGLHSVSLAIRDPAATIRFLTDVLGLSVSAEESGRTRLAAGPDLPGHRVEVLAAGAAPDARNGIGTVHHVALAVASDEEQQALREDLLSRRIQVTEIRDRQYFRSIYFREPGGVLLEVATMAPGFAVDEAPEQLGCGLKLPPWEEPKRPEIEARLPSLSGNRAR